MSQGSVPNVGGPDKGVIRPQNPPTPKSPSSSQGMVHNVGGPDKGGVVKGGTDKPTG